MNLFNSIRVTSPKSNSFDLSHTSLFSLDGGWLVPFNIFEVLPGDKMKYTPNVFFRLAPLVTPIMQEISAYVRTFYIPYRLCWDKWTEFIGEPKKKDSPRPVMPYINLQNVDTSDLKNGTLLDYLGFPTSETGSRKGIDRICALPFIAYQLVYNEYFLNECVSDDLEIFENVTEGELTAEFTKKLLTLRKASWRKDYFTSAMDNTQRGDDVLIPISADVNIERKPGFNQSTVLGTSRLVVNDTLAVGSVAASGSDANKLKTTGNNEVQVDNSNGLIGRLAGLKGTINDLRTALRTQEWLELSQRVGRRYKEQILGYFGISINDGRVDRPEYLGGFKVPVIVNDVTQTSETSSTPLGTMAGRAVGFGSNQINYSFLEHGICMSFMYIVPRASYSQGLHKMFMRSDKLDFYFPHFAHLGEQEIKNYEIYAASDGENDGTFGYAPRYSEYKWLGNDFHGAFRVNGSLNRWHLGREFRNRPRLNTQFTEVAPEALNRIFAYEGEEVGADEHHFWCQVHNDLKMLRKMPYYGTPKL